MPRKAARFSTHCSTISSRIGSSTPTNGASATSCCGITAARCMPAPTSATRSAACCAATSLRATAWLERPPHTNPKSRSEKGAAAPGGRGGRARTRSGDGEGWGRDRGRVAPVVSTPCWSARRRSGDRRAVVTERDPDILVRLRLPLDEVVAGLRPEQDLILLIVEDELALVGLHGEHGVALAFEITHDRDQQRLPWPARLHQHPALEQDIILAVAIAVVRVAPALDHTPMIHIGHGLDRVIDPLVDPGQILPGLLREHDIACLERPAVALARRLGAEVAPADRRTGTLPHADEQGALVGRLRGGQADHSQGCAAYPGTQ